MLGVVLPVAVAPASVPADVRVPVEIVVVVDVDRVVPAPAPAAAAAGAAPDGRAHGHADAEGDQPGAGNIGRVIDRRIGIDRRRIDDRRIVRRDVDDLGVRGLHDDDRLVLDDLRSRRPAARSISGTPLSSAFFLIRWTASMTSPCWSRNASPSCVVHWMSSASRFTTSGTAAIDWIAGSHGSLATASAKALSLRVGFFASHCCSWMSSSGYVAATSVWASSGSGRARSARRGSRADRC